MNNTLQAIIQKTRQSLVASLLLLDTKITKLIPNPKLRKVLYIGIGSLFGFMFLIILLGLLLSPMRNNKAPSGLILNKPKIETSTSTSQKELNEIQKEILKLETEIKELRFPESKLNIPLVEKDIKI